jgi:hypothetical protein
MDALVGAMSGEDATGPTKSIRGQQIRARREITLMHLPHAIGLGDIPKFTAGPRQ